MHHAYLLIASPEVGIAHAREQYGIGADAHPDVHVLTFAMFGIDEARMIKEWAYQRPVAAEKRTFIVACDDLTHETQNALLKLFEEPPQTSVFSLIISREEKILPTLRSRFEVVRLEGQTERGESSRFLALSYGARLEEVLARTKAKDLEWQQALLKGLEKHFSDAGNTKVARMIMEVEEKIGARGASPKMLLEHIALALPGS